MLDIQLIRNDPDKVRKNLSRRRDPNVLITLEKIITLDQQHLRVLSTLNNMRADKNKLSIQLSTPKNRDKQIIERAKIISNNIKENEVLLKRIEDEKTQLMLSLPNLLDDSVPNGDSHEPIWKDGSNPRTCSHPVHFFEYVSYLTERGLVERAPAAERALMEKTEDEFVGYYRALGLNEASVQAWKIFTNLRENL